MRPVEDDENLPAGGEMLPLRVGMCHVGKERAMAASPGMKQHRQVAGERGGSVVADEGGEAVLLDKRSELAGVRNSEGAWNIHDGIIGRARKRLTWKPSGAPPRALGCTRDATGASAAAKVRLDLFHD